MSVAVEIAKRHFGAKVVKCLERQGIIFTGLQAIPVKGTKMPFANTETGYLVNDNGCARLWTAKEVLLHHVFPLDKSDIKQ